jgi:tetratricopeptide (TPR) repeat protein
MTALWKAKALSGCLELAKVGISQTGNSASAVDFAYYALECSNRAPSASPAVSVVRQGVERQLDALCHQGSPELSPDDRADACDKLSTARTALGDRAGARRATEERLSVLTRALEGKPPDVAITYDWALTETLIQLDRAPEALSAATLREGALPDNYNPPHNRAKSLKALGKWDDGLVAIERALALAYGPRRVGLMTLKADLLLGAGRRDEAVKTLEDQLTAYRALPDGQKQPAAETRVEQRLKDMQSRPLPLTR